MHVEFLGIPRQRAGVSEAVVEADTLGQVLQVLHQRFPALRDLIAPDCLHPSIAANLNGDSFIRDPQTRLEESDRLLLMSADVGG